ncbi:putative fatty acyl-CoA reductase CG8303 [Phlebotomus argentipes]|uniref:putative fatty acyl-CoA reductase CG8303 n=1 Tax=Phlebotomus argentipes TaxID=94469 RepID=UPI0028932784|nr:putative fatty acyl-CoA reductase CG8303 [Phlebotomus argentipes]
MEDQLMKLEDFFDGKGVFITGGTGFLGTGLLEALLGVSPNIGKIYVLVREKRGMTPAERFKKIFSKENFRHHSEETLKKVIPIAGDLISEDFGLAPEILQEIIENVNIIYHSAGLIKFNRPLKMAIELNVLSTLRNIHLAKKLKKLSAFVYVSTALANINVRGQIEEKVYWPGRDPHELIKLATANLLPISESDPEFMEIVGRHENSYTFSKQVAENLIQNEMASLPVGIIRPSAVYGSYTHPLEGWCGSASSGHLGYVVAHMKGATRCLYGDRSTVLFAIPCDFFVNGTLVLTCYVGTRPIEQPEVIHMTSNHKVNKLTLGDLNDIMNCEVTKNPCNSYLWRPHSKVRKGWRYELFNFAYILLALLIYVPEKIFRFGPRWMSGFKIVLISYKGAKYFANIANKIERISIDNGQRIMRLANPEDKQRYAADVTQVNWPQLFARSIKWAKTYYYRETKKSSLRHHVIYYTCISIEIFLFALVGYILYIIFSAITSCPEISSVLSAICVLFIHWL